MVNRRVCKGKKCFKCNSVFKKLLSKLDARDLVLFFSRVGLCNLPSSWHLINFSFPSKFLFCSIRQSLSGKSSVSSYPVPLYQCYSPALCEFNTSSAFFEGPWRSLILREVETKAGKRKPPFLQK